MTLVDVLGIVQIVGMPFAWRPVHRHLCYGDEPLGVRAVLVFCWPLILAYALILVPLALWARRPDADLRDEAEHPKAIISPRARARAQAKRREARRARAREEKS